MIDLDNYIPLDKMHSFKFNGFSSKDHPVYSRTKSLEVFNGDGIMFPNDDLVFTYSNN